MQSKSTGVTDGDLDGEQRMDETVFERICDTIFALIPEVPRLKQLFQSWCQLGADERSQLDAKVGSWCSSNRKQLYKPLREALSRWECVQDTQGAPGCEPGIVSFSCDPQLEEDLVSVICSLELIFARDDADEEDATSRDVRSSDAALATNGEDYLRGIVDSRDATPHSVHSAGDITELRRNSDDELTGYVTN